MIDTNRRSSIPKAPVTLLLFAALTGTAVSGCIGFGFEEECKLPTVEGPQENSRPALSEFADKWRHTWDDDPVLFVVMSLRTSPPENPYEAGEGEPEPDTTNYVDWHSIRRSSYSEALHDLLCVSEWRRESIPTFTEGPYGTTGGIGSSIYNETMEKLRYEFNRQNSEEIGDKWCCYILFNDEFYGTRTKEAKEF